MLKQKKPIIFGVLTVDTYAQALARCGLHKSDANPIAGKTISHKGVEAAEALKSMLDIQESWEV